MTFIETTDVQDGQVISAAAENNNMSAIKTVVNGQLDDTNIRPGAGIAMSKLGPGQFAPFTPVWSSSANPQPQLGNGSLEGAYQQIGKAVICYVKFDPGSTTTYGGGYWYFSVPIVGSTLRSWYGDGLLTDSATATPVRTMLAVRYDATSSQHFLLLTNEVPGRDVGASVPHAWKATDLLEFSILYEAA
jgi:hypothetical protein